jgi:hypothetical protein
MLECTTYEEYFAMVGDKKVHVPLTVHGGPYKYNDGWLTARDEILYFRRNNRIRDVQVKSLARA